MSQIDKCHSAGTETEQEQVSCKVKTLRSGGKTFLSRILSALDELRFNIQDREVTNIFNCNSPFPCFRNTGINISERIARSKTVSDCFIKEGMQAAQVAGGRVFTDSSGPKPGLIIDQPFRCQSFERDIGLATRL